MMFPIPLLYQVVAGLGALIAVYLGGEVYITAKEHAADAAGYARGVEAMKKKYDKDAATSAAAFLKRAADIEAKAKAIEAAAAAADLEHVEKTRKLEVALTAMERERKVCWPKEVVRKMR